MSTFAGCSAAFATRHGKEAVLGPLFAAELGLHVELETTIDTDRFGTFTREIRRGGSALETARAKAAAALEADGEARFGLASEGSFGRHPALSLVAAGAEVVLLLERQTGLELVGHDLTLETNYASVCVDSIEAALVFARSAMFPSHGVLVMPAREGAPNPALGVVKGIVDAVHLAFAVSAMLESHDEVWLETDMRAHVNPTRRSAILRAGRALVVAAQSACPSCGRPGYVARASHPGRPCSECGMSTAEPRAEVLSCAGCGRWEERCLSPGPRATVFACPRCNP